MKLIVPLIGFALLLVAPAAQPAGFAYHVDIKCELKRLQVNREVTGNTETAEESWVYHVSITNHSGPSPALRVEYREYSTHEKFGSLKGAHDAKPVTGEKTFDILENNAQVSFDTDPVKITKARLKADWEYGNGAKRSTQDSVKGIWLRAYSGPELIDEATQPSALKSQEKWEGDDTAER